MAKAQFPIDGKLGKDFKATSLMGMRIHPVTKQKKHHNGTDIWSPHEPCWIEAPYDGKVIEAKKSTSVGGGFGNYVIILMKINGKEYTTLFAHMQDSSLKVKKGQKITAGTPLGKMGTTGMSTGKHLHWELRLGNKHIWDANGKHYIEPIGFFKALIAYEASVATAPMVTDPKTAPVAPAPEHNDIQAAAIEAERVAAKTEAAVAKKADSVSKKPSLPGELKVGSSGPAVAWLQGRLGVAVTGKFDASTKTAVIKFQKTRKEITKPDGIIGPLSWKALG